MQIWNCTEFGIIWLIIRGAEWIPPPSASLPVNIFWFWTAVWNRRGPSRKSPCTRNTTQRRKRTTSPSSRSVPLFSPLLWCVCRVWKLINRRYPQLESPLDFSSGIVGKIAMSREGPAAGTDVTVAGWGTLSSGGRSPILPRKVGVSVISNQDCSNLYGDGLITDKMMCAGVPQGSNTLPASSEPSYEAFF